MASNFTNIALAKADLGQYKKQKMWFNNTAGFDASNGGAFVKASGYGVVEATACADIFGIIVDAVASGGAFVDVYCGLMDEFTAICELTSGTVMQNGQDCYAYTSKKVGVGTTGLDIVGRLAGNGTDSNKGASLGDGNRVQFQLMPSEAIPGYDSGNTA